ncbi:hypothetical protein HaLaN_29520 [Haematococcus lacustris]|uniref:Uncharacterized protein n=1 Tax=Haematococcus lacustris TaxID=44745 RepID=A0A6A0AE81_HAELA|nr:hypothetical protein HaLaN_29520 [Haematococcus lacustris]
MENPATTGTQWGAYRLVCPRTVIKVPGGAVLRGCKKTKRKLMAHFQLRAGGHSQLRVIASLYVLRIFLTCLVGYSTPGYPSASTPPAVQPPRALDVAPLPQLPLPPPTLRPPSARLAARHPPPAAPTGPPMPLDCEDPVMLQQLQGIAEQREFVFNPATQIGVGIDPGVTQAVSAASGVWDPQSGQLLADQLRRWKLTKGQVKHGSGLNNARRATQRWLAPIKSHLQHLAAASSAGTSLEANLKHITVTLATWDAVWEVYLDPKGQAMLQVVDDRDHVYAMYRPCACHAMGTPHRQKHCFVVGNN